jgi:alpha-tubulin suppressor-like RCC1 family protein
MHTHEQPRATRPWIRSFFALALAGPVTVAGCGAIESPPAELALSTTVVDFGPTDCGSASAVPQIFTVGNDGGRPLTFSLALAGGADSNFIVMPTQGTVAAGSHFPVFVFSRGVPAVSATTPDLYADTLTITSDAEGDAAQEVAIKQTARGAVFEVVSSTVTIDGVVPIGEAATGTLAVKNVGNAAVEATARVDGFARFDVALSGETIEPGATATVEVVFTPTRSGVVEIETGIGGSGGPVCGEGAVTVVGEGSFAGTAAAVVINQGTRLRESNATLFAILNSGMVAALGNNSGGSRGLGGAPLPPAGQPNVVRLESGEPLRDVVELSGARALTCARTGDGEVYCWGNVELNRAQEPGVGQPFAALHATGVSTVNVGYGTICVVVAGTLSCNGNPPQRNFQGNLADWTADGVTQVTQNNHGGYALTAAGEVLSFGANSSGERGSAVNDHDPPSLVTGLTGVVSVAGNGTRVGNSRRGGCAIRGDRTAACWGTGRHGRLGTGSITDTNTPGTVLVDASNALGGIRQISGAHGHVCAVASAVGNVAGSDRVFCWGRGDQGRIGRVISGAQAFAQLTSPVIEGATSVAVERRGGCATTTAGNVLCWGQQNPFAAASIAPVELPAFAVSVVVP